MGKNKNTEIIRSASQLDSMCKYCRFGSICYDSTEKKENKGLLPVKKCPGFERKTNGRS